MDKVEKGRKHTKQRATVVHPEFKNEAERAAEDQDERDPKWLWEVRPPRVSLRRLPALKEEALKVIRAAGIDPSPYLKDAPHGSALRREILTFHDDPSELTWLAARIYERAAHAQAYRELGARDQAMNAMAELGGLVALFDIYSEATAETSEAGRKGAADRIKDGQHTEAEVLKLAGELTQAGKDPRSIAGLIAARLGITARRVRAIRAASRDK